MTGTCVGGSVGGSVGGVGDGVVGIETAASGGMLRQSPDCNEMSSMAMSPRNPDPTFPSIITCKLVEISWSFCLSKIFKATEFYETFKGTFCLLPK